MAGDKSSLFYEWLRIKNECKPKYFLLENVVMNQEDVKAISDLVGVTPVRINSSLVSAQLRDRLYWTNIGGIETTDLFGNITRHIEEPKDRCIVASDILDSGRTERTKFLCLTARCGGRWGNIWDNDKFKQKKFQEQLVKRGKKAFDNIVQEDGFVRPLTTSEMRKLQTIPEWYKMPLNWVDAANLLGDGWTVEVIKYLLQPLTDKFKTTNKDE